MSQKPKIDLPRDWKDPFRTFEKHDVRYLIVGGVAANFHGHPRFTQDLDLFLDRSAANAQAAKNALDDFGFSTVQISAEDLARPEFVIMLGRPPNRVDLLTDIKPLTFDEAWSRRCEVNAEDLKLTIISVEDLIAAKTAAGRPKDLMDLAALNRILNKRSSRRHE